MSINLQVRPLGAQVRYDGQNCLFMLKRREAERLAYHIEEDLREFARQIPITILSLRDALAKALRRLQPLPLWKSEQDCFAWQHHDDWIQVRLPAARIPQFVESAMTMPRYTANPGHPSANPARRWPCLSDLALLVQMMPAMHERQKLPPGRTSSLEIVDVFQSEEALSDKL